MLFQYYIPGKASADIDRKLIKSLGLGDVLFDCLDDVEEKLIRMDVARGPDGSSGALFAAVPIDPTVDFVAGYFPEKQKWSEVGSRKSDEEGQRHKGTKPQGEEANPQSAIRNPQSYWLGSDTDTPPTPASLRRRVIMAGLDLVLGDGNTWTAPTMRHPSGETHLPSRWGVNGAGTFETSVLPDYEAYWELAGELFDISFGERECETAEAFDYAARCLGLNYRVGPHEVTRLGLLDSTNYHQITKACVDGQRIMEFIESPEGQALLQEKFGDDPARVEKKSDPPPPDTPSSPGSEDNSPDIVPAGENST